VVLFNECGECRGTDERSVAGQDDDVVVIEQVIVWERRERDRDRIACPSWERLFHEVDLESPKCLIGHHLGDLSPLVADNHDDSIDVDFSERPQGVDHHREPAQSVERFGQFRTHPTAFTGGQHYRGQRA
jgi:hypothetical protein